MTTGASMAYVVGGQEYRTKADVEAAAMAIRDGIPIGTEIVGADRDFMLELLAHHEEALGKIGGGLSVLSTMRNQYGTVSFSVTRADGSPDDFSVRTCLKGLKRH